jgi:predicted RNA-binding Zn-ribbon protein involved in translation (DUF1610 family)
MSHAVDETYDVYEERTHRARKPRTCNACEQPIDAGEKYVAVFIVFDGDREALSRCARCQTIHLHLRKKGDGEMWPDEKLDCGEDYEEHWGEAPPDEVAALAFALPGEVKL